MRLRRLELVIIGVTLAFACFMGGFFTGRSWSAVNITAVATQHNESYGVGITVIAPETPVLSQENKETPAPPAAETTQSPPENTHVSEPEKTTGAPREGDGKININLASQSELTDLPGIGNVLASRIVDYRRQNGDFSRIEDIRNVSGIGEKRYEAIREKITVG